MISCIQISLLQKIITYIYNFYYNINIFFLSYLVILNDSLIFLMFVTFYTEFLYCFIFLLYTLSHIFHIGDIIIISVFKIFNL